MRSFGSTRSPLLAGLLVGAATLSLTVPAAAAPPGNRAAPVRVSYTNPVSASFADTFADPSVIRGLDGYWYAYGTSDPLQEEESELRRIPMARSTDLATWEYVGDAFTAATVPTWADAAADARIWAPDIRYVDGQYRMYYVVTQTTVTDELGDGAIGMATAPTPTGPWTDSGAPVVGPRRGASGNAGDFLWTFDPSVVTERDGSQWLFYGSYYGGVFVTELSRNGRRAVGRSTQVAIDNKFEGAYPVRKGGYWYLFASTANCCAGPTTGYSVQVGRSRSITGPYLDREGVSLTASRAGGTPTLVQNGNAWVGVGHNAVLTDLAGQDWIVYHGIDRADPFLAGTEGINERPMLMDRLDWVGGWPAVRAGRGPSEGERRGPATGGPTVTDFTGATPAFDRTGAWRAREQVPAGRLLTSRRAGTVTAAVRPTDRIRVEADLRSTGARYGLQARVGSSTVRATLDPRTDRLTLQQVRGGRVVTATRASLPARLERHWHDVSLEVRGRRVVATVSSGRLGDPVGVAALTLDRAGTVRRAGAFAAGRGVDLDNLSVLRAARLVTRLAPDRVPSRLDRAASDEFGGADLRREWTWVRRDPAATVADGRLRWPTQAKDLVGEGNDASVLLRPSPGNGDWTVETKLTIDLGTDEIRNFSQGGLIAYVDDDRFARLSHVAIWNTRQTEFGQEIPWPTPVGSIYGGTIVGPPAATTWLRLTHRLDPLNGEHELRAWTSRDGRRWVKGGVWTMPAGADVKVGLVSHGGAGATSEFDYFRIYR